MKYLKKFDTCADLRDAVLSDSLESENVNLIGQQITFNAGITTGETLEKTVSDNPCTPIQTTSWNNINDIANWIYAQLSDSKTIRYKIDNGSWHYLEWGSISGEYALYGATIDNNHVLRIHDWEQSNNDHIAIQFGTRTNNSFSYEELEGTYTFQILDINATCYESTQVVDS